MFFKFIFTVLLIASSLCHAKGIEDAKGYKKNSSLQWTAAKIAIDSIDWEGNKRVLDVGCGDGKITALIAKKYTQGNVVGIDISDSMIQFATDHFAPDKFSNLSFFTGCATSLPFQDSFDLVVSFSTLHWVVDQFAALRSILYSLVPGGKVFIVTWGTGPANVARLSENLMQTEKWKPFFTNYKQEKIYFSTDEYLSLMEEVGFIDVSIQEEWTNTVYTDRKALINWLLPLLTFTNCLTPELKQEFVNEMVDQVVSLSPKNEDGSIILKNLKQSVTAIRPYCHLPPAG